MPFASGSPREIADVDTALGDLPRQLGLGFTTICFKPAIFCRTVEEVPALCRHLVAAGEQVSPGYGSPGSPSPSG